MVCHAVVSHKRLAIWQMDRASLKGASRSEAPIKVVSEQRSTGQAKLKRLILRRIVCDAPALRLSPATAALAAD
jgi:hypothetical protein